MSGVSEIMALVCYSLFPFVWIVHPKKEGYSSSGMESEIDMELECANGGDAYGDAWKWAGGEKGASSSVWSAVEE